MKLRAIAICALVACASPAAADPRWAYAQGYESSPVSPYRIHATLRANHLRAIGRPGWLGRYLAVRAVDDDGTVVRVLLDPRYGDVVSVEPMARAAVAGYRPYGARPYRPYGDEPRYGALPPDVRSAPPPPRAANPPASRSAALTPPRTPLPRPRPAGSADTATATVVPGPVARPRTAPAPEPMARPSAEQPAPGAAPSPAPADSFPPVPSFD